VLKKLYAAHGLRQIRGSIDAHISAIIYAHISAIVYAHISVIIYAHISVIIYVTQGPKTCRLWLFYLIISYTASASKYCLQIENILFLTEVILD